jgi:hypothetical protein
MQNMQAYAYARGGPDSIGLLYPPLRHIHARPYGPPDTGPLPDCGSPRPPQDAPVQNASTLTRQ